MNIEIKSLNDFTKQEKDAFAKLEELAFGNEESSEDTQTEEPEAEAHEEVEIEWIPSSEWHVFVWEDDSLVGHVEFSERTVQAGDEKVAVACIGGVCTDPNYRKKGYARIAMKAAHEFIVKNMKVSHFALLTGDHLIPFYQQFDYSVVDAPCVMEQKRGTVPYSDIFMVSGLSTSQWPTGSVDLCGLPW